MPKRNSLFHAQVGRTEAESAHVRARVHEAALPRQKHDAGDETPAADGDVLPVGGRRSQRAFQVRDLLLSGVRGATASEALSASTIAWKPRRQARASGPIGLRPTLPRWDLVARDA